MRIGDVAKRANIPASTLRYYERIGLIDPPQRIGGQRHYDEGILDRLKIIQIAKDAGFSLNDIRPLLEADNSNEPLSSVWRNLAQQKIVEIETIIQQYQGIHRMLSRSIDCHCRGLADCNMIN